VSPGANQPVGDDPVGLRAAAETRAPGTSRANIAQKPLTAAIGYPHAISHA
jgi:hypothetical protein